jgi:hypothetical protein
MGITDLGRCGDFLRRVGFPKIQVEEKTSRKGSSDLILIPNVVGNWLQILVGVLAR